MHQEKNTPRGNAQDSYDCRKLIDPGTWVIFQQTIVPLSASFLTLTVLLAGQKLPEFFVRVQHLNRVHFSKILLDGVAEEKNREIKEGKWKGMATLQRCHCRKGFGNEPLKAKGRERALRSFPAIFQKGWENSQLFLLLLPLFYFLGTLFTLRCIPCRFSV